MNLARLYARGQITIPKEIREHLAISPGESVVLEPREQEVVMRKPRGILESGGIGAPRKRVAWKKARAAAWEEHAREVARK